MATKRISLKATLDQKDLFLFIDWLHVLIHQLVGVQSYSSSSNSWSLRLRDDSECIVSSDSKRTKVLFPDSIAHAADRLIAEALERLRAKDFGEPAWWMISLSSRSSFDEVGSLHMARNLSEHKRFQGPWKFSNDVILYFTQEEAGPTFAIVAKQEVKIIFRTPGPCNGLLSKAMAEEWAQRFRAIVSFVSASPHEMFMAIFPANEQERVETNTLLDDGSIGEIFADEIQLAPHLVWLLHASEEGEAFHRVINAMLAYEHALEQKSDPAAIIFLVTAIEALAVPNAPWQKERIFKRFRELLLLACPDAIDEVMRHANFEEAFGRVRNRNDFIDKLYSLRSKPVHTGQLAGNTGFFHAGAMRIALVSIRKLLGRTEYGHTRTAPRRANSPLSCTSAA